MGLLRYLGIEIKVLGNKVARSKEGIRQSQWKYSLDILQETDLMEAKLVETPMDPNVKLCVDQDELLTSPIQTVSGDWWGS